MTYFGVLKTLKLQILEMTIKYMQPGIVWKHSIRNFIRNVIKNFVRIGE